MAEMDPDIARMCDSCADALFKAAVEWCNANEVNAFYLAHAMGVLWFTYCGQLSQERQQMLLDHFSHIAFAKIKPPEEKRTLQ